MTEFHSAISLIEIHFEELTEVEFRAFLFDNLWQYFNRDDKVQKQKRKGTSEF